MPDQIVLKRGFSIGLLILLRAVAPALVAIGMLLVISAAYGISFALHFRMLAILVLVLAPLVLQLPSGMSSQLLARRWSIAASLVLRWMVLLGILLLIGYATKISAEFSRRVILTWAVLTPVPLVAVTLLINRLIRSVMFSPGNVRTAVFAGYNEVSVALAERMRRSPELCVQTLGFFDDRSVERLGVTGPGELLGGLSDLAPYVKSRKVEVIFVALPMRHVQRVLDLLEDLRDTTASIYYVPDIFVFDLIQSRTGEILGMPVVAMCETPFFGYRGVVKRSMDFVVGMIALLMLAPVLAVIALAIKSTSPGPVLFRQRRYGLDGREIHVFKFRTMTVVEDGEVIRQATRDDPRITPVGRVLRRFSLDELPQLFNVINGSMSLVGPRPHAVAHNEEYRKLIRGYMIRHKVLPGMTGLAQVSGCRGETRTLEEMRARIEYDLDYLRHWSPMLDLKIMVKTALMLLRDRKAY